MTFLRVLALDDHARILHLFGRKEKMLLIHGLALKGSRKEEIKGLTMKEPLPLCPARGGMRPLALSPISPVPWQRAYRPMENRPELLDWEKSLYHNA